MVVRGYDIAYAKHVIVETKPDEKDWKVSVTLYLDVDLPAIGTLTASLFLNMTHKVYVKHVVIWSAIYSNIADNCQSKT